ncbi:MAG: L-serine ammonia-lyase, iron-sulfur-dependent, subunit alpha [Candidatus Gastranaerophilales bacterium]|nr:L-serine ammonia-lyase, iron-sulfur-dependent, subunit alpha [Candidatus Gastranaerophilales bacterium]
MLNQNIINILNEEIVPAEGCTEPVAIAYVAAKAREILGELPEKIKIFVSGNMIKNVKSVIIPNSGGLPGIDTAAVMGALFGDPNKDLLVISHMKPADMNAVKNYLNSHQVETFHEKNDIKLYIKVEVYANSHSASVEVKHLHTNVTKIEKDGKRIVKRVCNDADFNSTLTDRKLLSIKSIYELAKKLDINDIKPLFEKVVELNCKIAEEGLNEVYGVNIGSLIQKNIQKGIYGKELKNICASYASAGSDARMSGCSLPVMTTSGSGNQGMAASLPVIKYCIEKQYSNETLLRALFFSHLATIHIKTNVGRLSAYCGVICACSAVAGAIAFIEGESYQVVADAITNSLGCVSGVICDGAKASCATKIANGVYAAFDSVMLAMNKKVLTPGDGIIGKDIEETIKNIGILSQVGMKETDEVILDIMENSLKK